MLHITHALTPPGDSFLKTYNLQFPEGIFSASLWPKMVAKGVVNALSNSKTPLRAA